MSLTESERGEVSLKASSERRNEHADPQKRARIGQKCDYLLTFRGLAYQPEVLIGEVSGGLPEAPNWKVWYDFLIKLVLGSRDCLYRMEKSGSKSDEESVLMYCYQLHGMFVNMERYILYYSSV